MTLRDHLQAVERATGRRPEDLNGPELHAAGAYLWEWFLDLHSERLSSGYGPQPITSTQIRDWVALTGYDPDSWDVSVIKALDRCYRNAAAEQQAKAFDKTTSSGD